MKGGGRRSESDEALVLRTTDLGEADRIVVLLARDHGRVEAVAGGARRFKSRFGASLEPLSRIRAVWRPRPGRELARLVEVELVESAYAVLIEPQALESLARSTRLVENVTLAGHASPALFRLLVALVEAARPAPGDPDRLGLLARYAEVWVSRLEGFWPDLDHCATCGRRLEGARVMSPGTEGALCRACARGQAQGLPLSREAATLARSILEQAPQALAESSFSARRVTELGRFTAALLSYHLERDYSVRAADRS